MNILISTTTNWNPGDDFIRYGVKNLLNSLYYDINYIHYDRNPDYFKPGIWEMGTGHKSNVMNSNIDWSMINLVVLAGSPEFIHGPLKYIYDGLALNPHIPLLAIGVGYSFPVNNLQLNDNEKTVLSRDNTLIITRQYDLRDKLGDLLSKEVHCLPCPALFAHNKDMRGDQYSKLAILQSPAGNQSLSEEDKLNTIFNIEDSDILVHYIQDLKSWPFAYFSTEARDLLLRIIQYKEVLSNRLHGGVVALGAGSSVTFVNSSNRVQKALEPYSKYINEDGFYEMTSDEVLEVKQEYIKLIRGII